MGRGVWTIPLPHHRGTPARRAIASRVCLSPVWTRRPALPGDVVRERIKNHPVNIRIHQVPGEPLAPRRGIPSGRGLRTTCWRQGSGADGLPFICPFPSAIAEGRRLALPTLSGDGALITVPVGTAPAPHTIPVGMVRVHPPAATPSVRDPFRVAGEGPGATTPPPDPSTH